MYETGGRTVVVYPLTQIVDEMFAWVTRGSAAPGVHTGSGSAPRIVQALVDVDAGVLAAVIVTVGVAVKIVGDDVAAAAGDGGGVDGSAVADAVGDAVGEGSATDGPATRLPDVATA